MKTAQDAIDYIKEFRQDTTNDEPDEYDKAWDDALRNVITTLEYAMSKAEVTPPAAPAPLVIQLDLGTIIDLREAIQQGVENALFSVEAWTRGAR